MVARNTSFTYNIIMIRILLLAAAYGLTSGLGARETPLGQLSGATRAPEIPAVAAVPEKSGGGTLTIYAYPPRRILDWSTPKTALADFATIAIGQAVNMNPRIDFISDFGEAGSIPRSYRSTMGHTIAHASCSLPDGTPYDAWTSFSGQDFPEVDRDLLLKDKAGLGMLFQDYIDGHIISGVENKMRLVYYKGKNAGAPGQCSPEASAWLSANNGRVAAGPVQKISDTRTKSKRTPGKTVARTVNMRGILVE